MVYTQLCLHQEGIDMGLQALAIVLAATLASIADPPIALAAGSEVVIGDIDDLSGLYADSN
jgi:hypothetical protein